MLFRTIYYRDNFEISLYWFFGFVFVFTTTGPPTKVSTVLGEHGQTLNRNKNEVN